MTIPVAQAPVSPEWGAWLVHTAGSAPGGRAGDPCGPGAG